MCDDRIWQVLLCWGLARSITSILPVQRGTCCIDAARTSLSIGGSGLRFAARQFDTATFKVAACKRTNRIVRPEERGNAFRSGHIQPLQGHD